MTRAMKLVRATFACHSVLFAISPEPRNGSVPMTMGAKINAGQGVDKHRQISGWQPTCAPWLFTIIAYTFLLVTP